MAKKQQTKGQCVFCREWFSSSGMTKHLKACEDRERVIDRADRSKTGTAKKNFHVRVEPLHEGSWYWLHLEVAGSAKLAELDQYLRAIWLECCNHLSVFLERSPGEGGGEESEISMDRQVITLFEPDVEIVHIYDFGTESVTRIRVIEERKGKSLTKYPVYLMARNDPPPERCQECGKQAEWLCMECVIEEDRTGALCAADADAHGHDEYPYLPVVNSPRVGMCGYTGPAEPPY